MKILVIQASNGCIQCQQSV